MDILDALDEIRSLNARQSKMDPIEVLLQKQKEEDEEQQRLTEADEDLVKSVCGEGNVKRLLEADDDDEDVFKGSLLVNPKADPEVYASHLTHVVVQL